MEGILSNTKPPVQPRCKKKDLTSSYKYTWNICSFKRNKPSDAYFSCYV